MELSLSEQAQQLLELLLTVPPQFDAAKAFLDQNTLSPDDVTLVGIRYADECFLDYGDYISQQTQDRCTLRDARIPDSIIPQLHSAYIYEVVKLLLEYGLQPNAVYASEFSHNNIMAKLQFIDHGYLAADTLALLLEHGGDPNLDIDGESVFGGVDFEIWFGAIDQEIRWRYDAWVHMWFVLLGYGGTYGENEPPIQTFKEYGQGARFDLKKLRDHRNFYYGLSIDKMERTVHIYDKKTFWEVARC